MMKRILTLVIASVLVGAVIAVVFHYIGLAIGDSFLDEWANDVIIGASSALSGFLVSIFTDFRKKF